MVALLTVLTALLVLVFFGVLAYALTKISTALESIGADPASMRSAVARIWPATSLVLYSAGMCTVLLATRWPTSQMRETRLSMVVAPRWISHSSSETTPLTTKPRTSENHQTN